MFNIFKELNLLSTYFKFLDNFYKRLYDRTMQEKRSTKIKLTLERELQKPVLIVSKIRNLTSNDF